uniref:Uncharacterized protein n=1 Tax=Sphaerodactylus townsendi TaxID=933632 RepID=A0ACB8FWT2_9SAUR
MFEYSSVFLPLCLNRYSAKGIFCLPELFSAHLQENESCFPSRKRFPGHGCQLCCWHHDNNVSIYLAPPCSSSLEWAKQRPVHPHQSVSFSISPCLPICAPKLRTRRRSRVWIQASSGEAFPLYIMNLLGVFCLNAHVTKGNSCTFISLGLEDSPPPPLFFLLHQSNERNMFYITHLKSEKANFSMESTAHFAGESAVAELTGAEFLEAVNLLIWGSLVWRGDV